MKLSTVAALVGASVVVAAGVAVAVVAMHASSVKLPPEIQRDKDDAEAQYQEYRNPKWDTWKTLLPVASSGCQACESAVAAVNAIVASRNASSQQLAGLLSSTQELSDHLRLAVQAETDEWSKAVDEYSNAKNEKEKSFFDPLINLFRGEGPIISIVLPEDVPAGTPESDHLRIVPESMLVHFRELQKSHKDIQSLIQQNAILFQKFKSSIDAQDAQYQAAVAALKSCEQGDQCKASVAPAPNVTEAKGSCTLALSYNLHGPAHHDGTRTIRLIQLFAHATHCATYDDVTFTLTGPSGAPHLVQDPEQSEAPQAQFAMTTDADGTIDALWNIGGVWDHVTTPTDYVPGTYTVTAQGRLNAMTSATIEVK